MNRRSIKRTDALKEILESKSIDVDVSKAADMGHKYIPNLLLSDTAKAQTNLSGSKSGVKQNPITNYVQAMELFQTLIDQEMAKSAKEIGIEVWQLKSWLDLQIEVPAKIILGFLRTIQHLHLDPLNDEIGFMQHEDGRWHTFISIEGCSKLLNHHKQFNGLVFTQSETLIEGVPEWIECSIYRRDRILPITVREHLIEVRSANPFWQKMPRRLLRHKALQQCVRLAFSGHQ